MKASEIATLVGSHKCIGNLSKEVSGVSSLSAPAAGSLVFCKKGNERSLEGLRKCIILVASKPPLCIDASNVYIVVDNPRRSFATVLRSAFAPELMVSRSLTRFTGFDFTVGDYVHIEGKVTFGHRVSIQSYVSIGTAGMGFERNEKGEWEYLPQIGGVVIGDDVDIGCHTNIQRGTLDDTIIGQGSKISVNCNIGHNTIIGKHTFVAGKSNFGGKTKIGDYCLIGMGVVTVPGVRIGNNVLVGAGSVVTKNIKGCCVAYGVPAKVVRRNRVIFGGFDENT